MTKHGTQLLGRGRLAVGLAFALIATLLVSVAPTPSGFGVAEAAPVPAPMSPMPRCVIDDNGNAGLGCAPGGGPVGATVGGTFAAGGTFTVTNGASGISACAYYTDAGCHFELYAPTIARCVYVDKDDATDVRTCPNLSTAGFVAPTRVGSCEARFGNVYMYGGPAFDPSTHYNARAARAADCVYNVPNNPIDNLYGPSFYLFATSVLECVDVVTGRCTDSGNRGTKRRVTEYAWLPVAGTLAPRADFDAEQGSARELYNFVNKSVPFSEGTTTYEWEFGDGETAVGNSPSHRYGGPGLYTVRLTMRGSNGDVRTHTETVDLDSPDLAVVVSNPDAAFGPGEPGNKFSVGDKFTLRIVVTATEGVGGLSGVVPTADLLPLPDQLKLVGDPVVVEPADMNEHDEQTFEIAVEVKSAGRFTVRSPWFGTDDAGRTKSGTGEFAGNVTGLKVEITPNRPSYSLDTDYDESGDITPEDNDVTFTVKVTNVTDAPITNIRKGPIDLTSRAEDDPAVRLFLQSSPAADFPDLAPSASAELEWVYRADDAVNADVATLIIGAQGPATITGLGEDVVRVFTNKLLEARIEVDAAQQFTSGKVVTISGNFRNVSDTTDQERSLSFQVGRILSGAFRSDGAGLANGGNAFFTTPGGATPEGMDAFRLEPGEFIDLDSIVQTISSPNASGFDVRYRVYVNAIHLDSEGNPVFNADGTPRWEVIDEMLVEIVEESSFSGEHDVTLAPVPREEESTNFIDCAESLLLTFYTGCKLARGTETMLRGLWGLGGLAANVAIANVQFNIWLYSTYFEWLLEDEAGRKALIDEVIVDIQAMVVAGHRIVQNVDVEQLILAVPKFIDTTITRVHKVLQTKDMKLIVGELAELAGENIDMVLEGLIAARTMAKVAKAAAGKSGPLRTSLQRSWKERADEGLKTVNDLISRGLFRDVPGSRALPAGLDLTDFPRIWRDSYGIDEKDFANLRKISEAYDVNIAFRSRSPKSVSLIDNGSALPKPQGIKTKGVNEVDMTYLDYPRDYDSIVIHMEPPIPWTADKARRRSHAKDFASDSIARNSPDIKPGSPEYVDIHNQIVERVETRAKEWDELTAEYRDALLPGPDGAEKGVKVDFDGPFNDFPADKLKYERNRRIKMKKEPSVNGRRTFRMKLEAPPGYRAAPDGSRFFDVTGDIDFLAILNPDGRVLGANGVLAELAKRGEIYEKMRALVGMQHGESFTIKNGKVRAKYVKDGLDAEDGETLLAMTPQGRLLTTYFDDSLSTLKGGPNSSLGELVQGRAYFSGIFSELRSPQRGYTALQLEDLFRASRYFSSTLPKLFTLSIMGRLVSGLEDAISQQFARDGVTVRPDGEGGLLEYSPDGSQVAKPIVAAGSAAEGNSHLVGATAAALDPNSGLAEIEAIYNELEADGVDYSVPAGASGGRWVPVSTESLLRDGTLNIAPFNFVASMTPAGSIEIEIASLDAMSLPGSTPYFEVGDQIVVDPGGPFEEVGQIASVTPFRLVEPLRNDHVSETLIILGGPVGSLFPLTPARLVETRVGEKTVDGVFEGVGRLKAGSVTPVQIAGRGGVAVGAAAVAVNVTAVRPSGVGYVTLFPCGADQPLTSSLNYGQGGVAGNSGIVKLNASGELCVFTFADTDLVLDVNAWLAEAPSFESLTPARLAETRSGEVTVDGEAQALGRLGAGSVTKVQIAGRGGVAVGADAVALNVTAIRPSGVGYVTLYPCDEDRPTTSSLNYAAGGAVGNSAVVSLAGDGKLCVFTFADTDLVLDVNAWLADDASFDPLVPARFFETRSGEETIDGDANGVGRLDALSVTPIQIAGRGGVSDGASAVALNVTAVRPAGVGYITLFPCDGDQPLTSSLNYAAGGAVGNSGIVKLAADGTVCTYTQADTDLVIDVNAAWTS